MTKQTEAMKLALEALDVATTPFARDRQEVLRAQAALREALAEQPAQRKPLTKTKVGNHLRRHAHGEVGMYRNGFKDGVTFAEAAHGIKGDA